ncbi:MAG: hypothetical protein HY551_06510 [Elusimicrobia bacterium]|nr:hypothetical protein [Elusimicrobiota bacterium]
MKKSPALLSILCIFWACAAPVRRTDSNQKPPGRFATLRKLLTRPPTYLPCPEHPRFSCEYPRRWGKPKEIPGGLEFRDPKGRASFSIEFFAEAGPGYKSPDAYRKEMTAWGAVEDPHRLFQVEISSRLAHTVGFTTYEYDPGYLIGEKVSVQKTEFTLVPDDSGIYILRYRSGRADFLKPPHRKHYEHFLSSLAWKAPNF